MITYSTGTMPDLIAVRLDGKLVGIIRHTQNGFRYESGKFHGEYFTTLQECKESLEVSE